MLNWLLRLLRHPRDAVPKPAVSTPVRVTHDDKLITVDDGAGAAVSVAWSDIGNISVLTTDAGPFEADLFWIMTDRDGRQSLVVPMGADGEPALLKSMQARLAGFDNMAVVEAMSSTSNAVFQIWPAAGLV
ncbi:hypothetical protein [Hyphomicrobium sp.]|uniref:hypothetical protein n=1 Tax=Hyphomicrobium sp. TaxID=82 RepID=UPI003F6EEF31